MGLIMYNGANPIPVGQKDPFVGCSISYDDVGGGRGTCGGGRDSEKSAVYAISLQGSLTGCSFTELNTLRDTLGDNFSHPSTGFGVVGLDLPSGHREVRVGSINFETSPYRGVISYGVELVVKQRLDADSFVTNKIHTLSFDIPPEGFASVNYTRGAQGMETGGCDSLQRAIDWVTGSTCLVGTGDKGSGLLRYNAMGRILNPDQTLFLKSKGEEIDRAESKYTKTWAYINDPQGNEVQQNHTVTTDITMPDCDPPKIIRKYDGDFSYKVGSLPTTTTEKEKVVNAYHQYANGILPSLDYPQSLQYDSGNNSLSYSFEIGDPPVPASAQIIYDLSLSESSEAGGNRSYSVGGNVSVEVGTPIERLALLTGLSLSTIIEEAHSQLAANFGVENLSPTNVSLSRENIYGDMSFNADFIDQSLFIQTAPNSIEGISGLGSYSLNMKVPLHMFKTSYVLGDNCTTLNVDLRKINRAEVAITARGISGATALGTTKTGIEAALSGFVNDKKKELATSPTRESSQPVSFEIDEKGCATYSQTFSWKTDNEATSSANPTGLTSNLLG